MTNHRGCGGRYGRDSNVDFMMTRADCCSNCVLQIFVSFARCNYLAFSATFNNLDTFDLDYDYAGYITLEGAFIHYNYTVRFSKLVFTKHPITAQLNL